MEPAIKYSEKNGVARITINRPEKMNSLRAEDSLTFLKYVAQAEKSKSRCLVIAGEGPAFCSGRDLEGFDHDTEDAQHFIETYVNPVVMAIRKFPAPVIAEVQGACLGLGFGVALSADIIIAADNALFGSPFRNIGCILDSGGHYELKVRIGRHKAAELIFTGALVSGRDAVNMGLINRSVGYGVLAETVAKLAKHIASGPAAAFAKSKEILIDDHDAYGHSLVLEAEGQGVVMKYPDAKEGISAFLEKRRPTFNK